MAPKIYGGYAFWYVVLSGKLQVMRMRSVKELLEMLKKPNQAAVSVEVMDDAIAKGAMPQ